MSSFSDQKPSIKELECSQTVTEPAVNNDKLALGASIKRYPKVVAYTFAIITGVLYVGFDTVIVGTGKLSLLLEHGRCYWKLSFLIALQQCLTYSEQ